MEIYQLRTFLAVAEHRSITQAAEHLFTTPPSASAHIKALEDELGVALFFREPQGMRLTPAGATLRPKARRLLQTAQEITRDAARLKGRVTGRLEIGLNTDPAFLRIAEITRRLQRQHPGIELQFAVTSSDRVIDRLRTGAFAAGFVYGERSVYGVRFESLAEVELVLAIPARWRTARRNSGWAEWAERPWIYTHCHCPFQQRVDRELQRLHLSCRTQVQADDYATRRELVRSGAGIAVLERAEALSLARDRSARLWRPTPRLFCPLYFAAPADPALNPAIEALRAAVLAAWRPGARAQPCGLPAGSSTSNTGHR